MFFLCSVTDISATVAPIGVKFCMMVTYWSRTDLLRAVPPGDPQVQNFEPKCWPFEREYLGDGTQRYIAVLSCCVWLSCNVLILLLFLCFVCFFIVAAFDGE